MNLITEFPHADYDKNPNKIDAIDFRIEKMPINKEKKADLAKAFHNKGIIGKMNKSNKYFLFSPTGIKPIKNVPKNDKRLLPPDWQKYAIVLKDNVEEKNRLKTVIQNVVREMLNEDSIGKISQQINVVVRLDKTKHAQDRQSRHSDKFITDTDIKMLANKALPKIGKMLIFNELDVNDRIGIYDRSTNLNLVGALEKTRDELQLVIVTVMIEKNFHFSKVRRVIRL